MRPILLQWQTRKLIKKNYYRLFISEGLLQQKQKNNMMAILPIFSVKGNKKLYFLIGSQEDSGPNWSRPTCRWFCIGRECLLICNCFPYHLVLTSSNVIYSLITIAPLYWLNPESTVLIYQQSNHRSMGFETTLVLWVSKLNDMSV